MSKKRTIEQQINFPVFRRGIQIFWTKDYHSEFNAYCVADLEDGSINPQIYFNTNIPVAITTITHELLHAVRRCLNVVGVKGTEIWDDEVLTYHLDYSLGECLDYCKKHKIKICNTTRDNGR